VAVTSRNLPARSLLRDESFDGLPQLSDLERFRDHRVADALHPGRRLGSGEQGDRWPFVAELQEQVPAVAVGQMNVEQDRVDPLASDQLAGLLCGRRLEYTEAVELEVDTAKQSQRLVASTTSTVAPTGPATAAKCSGRL
jgi:hypothetical protein